MRAIYESVSAWKHSLASGRSLRDDKPFILDQLARKSRSSKPFIICRARWNLGLDMVGIEKVYHVLLISLNLDGMICFAVPQHFA